jgi:hypothetical protein
MWQDNVVERAISSGEEFDGILFENANLTWPDDMSSKEVDYYPELSYNSILSILSRTKESVGDKLLSVNGYKDWAPYGYRGDEFMANSDMIFFDGFLTTDKGAYKESDTVRESLESFINIADMEGKKVAMFNYGNRKDYKKRTDSLSTYLIVARENTYYTYRTSKKDDLMESYAEYYLETGQPKENFSVEADVYKREFEKVKVIINLSNEDYVFNTNEFIKKLSLEGGGTKNNPGYLIWERAELKERLEPMSGIILSE